MPTTLTREICRDYIEENLFGSRDTILGKSSTEVGLIGLELESFPYRMDLQKRIHPVKLYNGKDSLINGLMRLSIEHGGVVRYVNQSIVDKRKPLVAAIEFPDGNSFHFEPGGQVEISTAPYNCMEKVKAALSSMQDILRMLTEQENIHFAQFGTNPWFTVDEIGMQMSKPRYRAMAHYFDNINSFGKQMMLQTCSMQVNIDLGTGWTTRAKRIVAANLLAPFATALFANSGITAGKVNGYKSYRSLIWQHLDTTRTGVLPIGRLTNTFDKDDLIDAYLEFALQAPIIYIEDLGEEIFPGNFTLEDWINHSIKGVSPTITHLKNHLTLLFPEVRLKGYIELRSADTPPREWQMIPACFYSGLLYSNTHLDKTLDLLLPFASQLPMLMEKAACGLESDDIFNISKKLMGLTIEGFANLPETFKSDNDTNQLISFSERFTLQRSTFADEYLGSFNDDKMLSF
jgi:glutamate--cysteine ligase